MKKVLSIIPARGGSKGLPRKNILEFDGKPLIGWTIEASMNAKFVTKTIVSSEDDEILSIASQYNKNISMKRSSKLSFDNTPSIDVVLDILDKIPDYDYVILLQPTSPLRKSYHIDKALNLMFDNNASSCTSVTLLDKSPYWMYHINRYGYLQKIIKENPNYHQRQEVPETYELNGSIYINSCKDVLKNKRLIQEKSIPYVMERQISTDIDNVNDFRKAEQMHRDLYNNK